jgi:hypothetical protein
MRRIARAVGAVSGLIFLAALWSAPAAAEEKSTKPRIAVIEFKTMPGHSAPAPLEILGFAWSDSGPARHRAGGSNQMSMDDTAGKEKSPSGFGEWIADFERPQAGGAPYRANDRLRNAGPKSGNAAGDPDRPLIAGSVPNPSAARGANETISIGGGRTETASGQATGKRQHLPIRARTYYDQAQGKGSVWIRVATQWAACRVGARYPSLRLAGGAHAYTLEDVTVASCGDSDDRPTEEVAFYYNNVTVRGWDPEKKEE